MENVVYLELLRRGYKVSIGKLFDYEVDFVIESPNEIKYYQVTKSLVMMRLKKEKLEV